MTIKKIAAGAALLSAAMMSQALAHEPALVDGGAAGMVHHLFSEADHVAAWVVAIVIGAGLAGAYLYNRARTAHEAHGESE